jgi:hypothetical protein
MAGESCVANAKVAWKKLHSAYFADCWGEEMEPVLGTSALVEQRVSESWVEACLYIESAVAAVEVPPILSEWMF